MNEDDILEKTKDGYLYLIHPVRENGLYAKEIQVVVDLAPAASDNVLGYQYVRK